MFAEPMYHVEWDLVLFAIEGSYAGAGRGKRFMALGGPVVSFARTGPSSYAQIGPSEYYTQIEVTVGLVVPVRLGVNPGEIVDFALGFTNVDIFGDDERFGHWPRSHQADWRDDMDAHLPELVKMLRDKDAMVRVGAAYDLGRIGPAAKDAVPALVEALTDKDAVVRAIAAEGLGRIGPAAKDAVRALIEALEDEEVFVRNRAAYALGEIGPAAKDAVPALKEALEDKDEVVRRYAAEALEKIEKPTEQPKNEAP
jgi:hypothetical protein